jgi:hypothetical protein
MLPSVTKAKYVKGYLIEIQFNDGTKKVIDFERGSPDRFSDL